MPTEYGRVEAGAKRLRRPRLEEFLNRKGFWLHGVETEARVASVIGEIQRVGVLAVLDESRLDDDLGVVRRHEHREMRQEHALAADQRHVVNRRDVSVIMHFHLMLLAGAPAVGSSAASRVALPHYPLTPLAGEINIPRDEL